MKKIIKIVFRILPVLCFIFMMLSSTALAAGGTNDMWTLASDIIKNVYGHIAAISTALAALMTAVAVIGMKMSNNQQKVDQSVDWLKRIWIAWAIINGIGAFLAYVQPLFQDYNSIDSIQTLPDIKV